MIDSDLPVEGIIEDRSVTRAVYDPNRCPHSSTYELKQWSLGGGYWSRDVCDQCQQVQGMALWFPAGVTA